MKGKRFLAFVTALSMVAAMAPQSFAAEAAETEYQIYPTPHSIAYEADTFTLDKEVNVILESGLDEATTNKIGDILEDHGLSMKASDKTADGTNILVGVYGSDEFVDTYAETNLTFKADTFTKFDSYVLDIDAEDETIVVLGKDTDGAFYGLVTLMHILNQAEGLEVRDLTMEDYADTSIRGFIEGYYGIPWSNEDRMSLMEFGGQFKMTSYVFAPKDDVYHTSKWRQLYPEEEIKAIEEMVAVGNANKCRFVWTAHPFMGGFNAGAVDSEITALLAKFDQLYDAGVRQFGVLGDDVGALDKNVVIQVMNAVSDWAAEKGDVYDSVFCPAGYNHSWQGNYSELNTYDAGFPDDVQIFWTGEAVCQPVEQKTLDHFRDWNATNGTRRAPLFWLNWPVNDINHSRMLMGKGSLLRTDINPEDLVGVVTNPMQEAEPSKVAIFAVADYTWNVADFNVEKSWVDSFPYIDADAADELYTLAKHMSDPSPNGHGLNLAESEELLPLINEFKTALSTGTNLEEVGAELAEEMQVIIDACNNFHAKTKNERMKENLLPYTNSLRDLATAIKNYALAAIAVKNDDGNAAFEYYSAGFEAHDASKKYAKQAKDGIEYVDPGSKHLMPLADVIKDAIADDVQAYVFGTEGVVELTASTNITSFYEGKIENIVDGNPATHAWHDGYEAVGQYYQVNLSKPATVYGIEILNGTNGKPEDTFGMAEVQYTTDGTNWTKVSEVTTYQPSVSVTDIALENVKAVRYICTGKGSGNKWPSMREFTLDLTGIVPLAEVYTNTVLPADATANGAGNEFTLSALNGVTLENGEYVGLKLDRIHVIKAIDVLTSVEGLTVEASKNGYEWAFAEEAGEARYIRVINHNGDPVTFDIQKFIVETVEFEEKAIEATNYGSFDGNFSALFDGDWTTAYQFANSQNAGKYITIDLGREIELNSFKAVCRDSEWDFPRHAKFSVSADGANWTEIMTLGSQTEANPGELEGSDNINDVLTNHEISYNTESVSGLNQTVRYIKFEITLTKVGPDKWVRFQEFEINGGEFISDENDPTFVGSGETVDNRYKFMTDASISTKYTFDGDLYYYQSEENVNAVKFVQSGISNAEVQVRLAGEDSYTTLGKLDKTICEFAIDGQIVDVKVVTNGEIPVSITEMLFSYTDEIPEITVEPTEEPTVEPTEEPTVEPTEEPTVEPTEEPTVEPTEEPTVEPTEEPTVEPTEEPTVEPTEEPTVEPTEEPTVEPTETPGVTSDVTKVFLDVYGDWYTPYVQYVYDNALMTGIKGTDNFEPNANITKAQVAQVLYNMEKQPGATADDVFKDLGDVYDAEWYADAVAWAYATGVVTGDLNTKKFNPNADVTREQLALMMFRYAKYKEYDVTKTSNYEGLVNADKVNNWAAEGMSWAVGAGLISGVEKGDVKDLDPQGNASRAQVAAILQRFCENVK